MFRAPTQALRTLARFAPKQHMCGPIVAASSALSSRMGDGVSLACGRASAPASVSTRAFSGLVGSSEEDEGEPVDLSEALASEIAEEAAEKDVDTELEDIKALISKTWVIEDTPGRGIVTLRSREGTMPNGETLEVVFDCQDEAEQDEDMDMDALEAMANGGNGDGFSLDSLGGDAGAGGEDGEGADGDELGFGINFNVAITKAGGEQLLIDAVAAQQLQVTGVQYVSAASNKSLQDGSVDGEVDHELYGGPVFDQLEEGLQDALYDYLEDRHVDDDLCFFVLSYARHKEQAEYVNWLHSVLNFVEKK